VGGADVYPGAGGADIHPSASGADLYLVVDGADIYPAVGIGFLKVLFFSLLIARRNMFFNCCKNKFKLIIESVRARACVCVCVRVCARACICVMLLYIFLFFILTLWVTDAESRGGGARIYPSVGCAAIYPDTGGYISWCGLRDCIF